MKAVCALFSLCAWSSAVFSQSNVSTYGLIDVGVTKANSGTSLNPGAGAPGQWNVQDANGSRLGFKGKEDLGDGLYARFDIQTRFNPDDGTSASRFWNGRTIVAIGNKTAGELYLGRDYQPVFWVANEGDPTEFGYVSQAGRAFAYADYSSAGRTDGSSTRRDNTVGYKSPQFAGFKTEIAVSAGEGARKRVLGGNIQYSSGAAYIGIGSDYIDGDNRLFVTTLGYNFGIIRPTLLYANQRSNGVAAKSITLAATVPVESGRIYGILGRLDPEGTRNNTSKLGLGYERNLSKRTTLYTNIGTAKTDLLTRSTAIDAGVLHNF